jgi:hypothetical protein
MTARLKYLSDAALSQLRAGIASNKDRYRGEGFGELSDDPAWDIGLGIEFDNELLATLDRSVPRQVAAIDLENSRIVGKALEQLTLALANEERIWVRLAHLEGFEYSRARWLDSETDADLLNAVETHMFASTQTGIRDDHALSRLWWNYRIARTCMPEDVDGALNLILKSADIRSNFVERIWMTSRQGIASAVLRAMKSDPWITGGEQNFRQFMKTVNRLGGGIVFEVLNAGETDRFVAECVAYARK